MYAEGLSLKTSEVILTSHATLHAVVVQISLLYNLTLSTLHKQCMLTTAAAELIFGILIPYTVVLSRPQYAYFWR